MPGPEVRPSNLHAVDFIINTLLESDEKLYLIPTGPLTNIGVALLREPRIKEKIERIVLMGGAAFDSNITPAAEFNIYVDPEAAKIVFESGLPLTMVGLDVTNKAIFSFKDIDRLEKFNGKVSKVVAPLLRFFAKANHEFFGFKGAPLHDPLAVSYVIDKTILDTKFLHVDIETYGQFTRGQTVVDIYGVTKKVLNAKDFIFRAIKILDKG